MSAQIWLAARESGGERAVPRVVEEGSKGLGCIWYLQMIFGLTRHCRVWHGQTITQIGPISGARLVG
jgi:hypothetical protein